MRRTNVLTDREREILSLVARGKSNRTIAQELYLAEATVENHLHNIFSKLGVSKRTEAVFQAFNAGLIVLEK